MKPPRLRPSDKARLELIVDAAHQGELAAMRSRDLKTGEPVTLLVGCLARPDGDFELYPLAAFNDDDPRERYADPTAEEPS